MPKYKNGKVKESRFKAQILIRNKGPLDLKINKLYKVYFEKLVTKGEVES
jgi:hypothetical protein